LHTEGAEARYRLIETVRIYAAEKLQESGEADEVRSRHRDWYQAWLIQGVRSSKLDVDHHTASFLRPGGSAFEVGFDSDYIVNDEYRPGSPIFETSLPEDSATDPIVPATLFIGDLNLTRVIGSASSHERISGDLANFR